MGTEIHNDPSIDLDATVTSITSKTEEAYDFIQKATQKYIDRINTYQAEINKRTKAIEILNSKINDQEPIMSELEEQLHEYDKILTKITELDPEIIGNRFDVDTIKQRAASNAKQYKTLQVDVLAHQSEALLYKDENLMFQGAIQRCQKKIETITKKQTPTPPTDSVVSLNEQRIAAA